MPAQVLTLPVSEHFKIESGVNRRGKPTFKLCHVGPWGDLVVAECRTSMEAECALREWQQTYLDFPVVRR